MTESIVLTIYYYKDLEHILMVLTLNVLQRKNKSKGTELNLFIWGPSRDLALYSFSRKHSQFNPFKSKRHTACV